MPVHSKLTFAPRAPLVQVSGNRVNPPPAALKREHKEDSDRKVIVPKRVAAPPLSLLLPSIFIQRRNQSRRIALDSLNVWIRGLGPDHRFVGTLGGDGTELKMPLSLGDG